MTNKFTFGHCGLAAASLLATISFLAFTINGIEAQARAGETSQVASACLVASAPEGQCVPGPGAA